ncbi:MAG: carbon storage regulator [Clostridia bacterium]|nr:carbon storage regulator [Clostridia bacterium]
MLVVSRKVGESLVIADNIKVTIVSAGSDKVSVGIEAPRDITVLRSELLETIEDNKLAQNRIIDNAGYQNLAALLKEKQSSGKQARLGNKKR